MRLHSNVLTTLDVPDALHQECEAGRIAPTVHFKTFSAHRSTTHARAWEVQLESWDAVKGDGRRRGNAGSYGTSTDYAATYDEWGWLMAALYRIDSDAVWGSVAHPQYADAADFHDKTGATYSLDELAALLDTGVDPYPYVRHPRIGRQGANRNAAQYFAWGREVYRYAPRTAAGYRAFAHLETR